MEMLRHEQVTGGGEGKVRHGTGNSMRTSPEADGCSRSIGQTRKEGRPRGKYLIFISSVLLEIHPPVQCPVHALASVVSTL